MNNNSGELVKRYRTLLKISQKEAAGTRMSHSMVSLIESGKIQMTTVTAMILADNLNKIALNKGLDLNLSLKDLLSRNNSSIESDLRNSLYEIQDSNADEDKYEEIFSTAKDNNCFELMAEIKRQLGNMAAEKEEYHKAIEEYCKAYDLFKLTQNSKGIAEIIIELAKCHNRLKEYKKAEEFIEKIKNEILAKFHDDQILFQANYQLLISMVYTRRNGEALKIIENILRSKRLNNLQRKDILMIKAGIFIDVGRFVEAISILKKMIIGNHCSDYMVYHRLAIANILMGQRQEGVLFISQCINLLLTGMDKDNTKAAIKLAEEFERYKMSAYSIKYYEFALSNSSQFNQGEYKYRCYKTLFDICDKSLSLDAYGKYVSEIEKILLNENVENLTNYFILMIKYYLGTSKINELQAVVNILSEKI